VLTQKAVDSMNLPIQNDTFLSSVWITQMPQRSIQVLNYSIFSENEEEIPVF